jgi:hypothetical protein
MWTQLEEQSEARICAVCGWPVVWFQLWAVAVHFVGQGVPKPNYRKRQIVDDYLSCSGNICNFPFKQKGPVLRQSGGHSSEKGRDE